MTETALLPIPDERAKIVSSRPKLAYIVASNKIGHVSRETWPGDFRTPTKSIQVFIDSKKLIFPFGVSRNFPSKNSIASTVPMGLRMRRST